MNKALSAQINLNSNKHMHEHKNGNHHTTTKHHATKPKERNKDKKNQWETVTIERQNGTVEMYSPAAKTIKLKAKPSIPIVTRDIGITEFTSRDESYGSSIDHGFE